MKRETALTITSRYRQHVTKGREDESTSVPPTAGLGREDDRSRSSLGRRTTVKKTSPSHLTHFTPTNLHTKTRFAFTLVEVMIVVVIIGLLAALSIPTYRRICIIANESAAITSMKAISAAEQACYTTYGTFDHLNGPYINSNPPFLNPDLTTINPVYQCVVKNGYQFFAWPILNGSITYEKTDRYFARAVPITTGTTGNRQFCVSESGVINVYTSGYPSCNGTPIGE